MRLRMMPVAAMIAATAIALPGVATAAQPKAAVSAAATEAGATVDAFHAALDGGDRAAALALLAPDALIFEAGGAERTRDEYAAHHLAADMAFSKAVPSRLVRRSGSSDGPLAWIASEGRTTGTWNGKAIDSVNTETIVLRRSGGGWTIVHIHWSSAAAPSN